MRAEPNAAVASFYSRLAKKKGDSKAIVAASAKLLKIIYWVNSEGEESISQLRGIAASRVMR